MKNLAALAISLVALSACGMTHVEPITKGATITSFGDYRPTKPESLDDLPIAVRQKVTDHLRDRLGPFADRLQLTGGQIVDFARLAEEEPNSKDYRWEVPAYGLDFTFHLPEAGVDSYTAELELRSDGSVLQEIDVPAFRTSPEKLKFISLEKAISLAGARGYARQRPEIVYLQESDSLAWRFWRTAERDDYVTQGKYLFISAHNGVILKETSSTAIH